MRVTFARDAVSLVIEAAAVLGVGASVGVGFTVSGGVRGDKVACPFKAGGCAVGVERGDSALLLVLGGRTVATGLRPRESSTSLAQSNHCGSSIASVVAALLGSVVVVSNAADMAVSAGAVMVVVAVVVTGWTLDWVRTGVRNTVP